MDGSGTRRIRRVEGAKKVLKAGEKGAEEAGDVIIAGESNTSISDAAEPDAGDAADKDKV